MTTGKKLAISFAAVLVLAIAAFFIVPTTLGLEAEGPPELVVGDRASEAIAAVLERGSDVALPEAQQPVEVGSPVSLDEIAGEWTIVSDSVAGYRVFKDFVGASEFEAVGRTSSVFGDLTIEGAAVTEALFSVDIATVTSDDDRRDAEFRGPVLNAAAFPFANFRLTSPIALGDVPTSGEQNTVMATGELTLKGVSNEVAFDVTTRLVDDQVQVAGSIDIEFSDYDIEPPTTPVIVVRDSGVIEFSLFFEKAGA